MPVSPQFLFHTIERTLREHSIVMNEMVRVNRTIRFAFVCGSCAIYKHSSSVKNMQEKETDAFDVRLRDFHFCDLTQGKIFLLEFFLFRPF